MIQWNLRVGALICKEKEVIRRGLDCKKYAIEIDEGIVLQANCYFISYLKTMLHSYLRSSINDDRYEVVLRFLGAWKTGFYEWC